MESSAHSIEFDRIGFLDAILATLPEAIAIVGPDLTLSEINPAGLALIGARSASEMPHDDPLSLVAPSCVVSFKKAFDDIISGRSEVIDHPLLLELCGIDGRSRMAECRMASLKGIKGEIAGVVLSGRDVSVREENVQKLTDSAALLSAILATVPDAMIVIDDDGLITSFSVTAEMMFGYEAREVVGKNVSILMAPPHKVAHDGYLKRYMDTGQKRIIGVGRVVEGRRRDGSIFPIELSIGEARIGTHRAFTGFLRDLTEKFVTETRLQEVQAELVHASRLSAVGTLASALAHELNQPLTAIANYVSAGRDLIKDGVQDVTSLLQEALDEASKEALRAGQIVRRMRDFVSKGELDKQILPLSKLVNDATTLGLVGAREKGVAWSIEIEPDIDNVLADRVQIQQVMVNLMRNAIEAMDGGITKILTIRARPDGKNQVAISVADTGHGVPAEMIDQLFLPFISTKAQGMGLGLSICRTIIEAHGGHLTVDAVEDGGTVFTFTLPRAPRENPDEQ
ncbi:MAG: PAS domain S-box protein [Sphingorhabdus sp.]